MQNKQKRIRTGGILKGTCDLLPPARPYLLIVPSAIKSIHELSIGKVSVLVNQSSLNTTISSRISLLESSCGIHCHAVIEYFGMERLWYLSYMIF